MPRIPPHRIKFLLADKGYSVNRVADEGDFRPSEVSMCINGDRIYPAIRLFIAGLLGKPVEKVFGPHPATTALLAARDAEQRSAA